MDIVHIVAVVVRGVIIVLGFTAMWSLWKARDARSKNWTNKMKDIWMCHMLLVVATVEINVEHLYKNVFPPAALLLIGFVYIWTVKGTFNGDMYTKDKDLP